MCDVPSITVFCSESIECLPRTASKYFLKLLVTISVAPIITGIIVNFRFHIIIIIIIINIIISFMQGIYNYIPETKYVPREYSVAAILLLIFMVFISLVSVLNLLYCYIIIIIM